MKAPLGDIYSGLCLNCIGPEIIKPATRKVLLNSLSGVEGPDWEGGGRNGTRNDHIFTQSIAWLIKHINLFFTIIFAAGRLMNILLNG